MIHMTVCKRHYVRKPIVPLAFMRAGIARSKNLPIYCRGSRGNVCRKSIVYVSNVRRNNKWRNPTHCPIVGVQEKSCRYGSISMCIVAVQKH
jgi:hypothetical protein